MLVGGSGSGKTTLLNMLAGLLTPSDGQVLVDGSDLYAMGDAKLSRFRNEHIGVIPQGQTALHSLSVLENVTYPALMYHPKANTSLVLEALKGIAQGGAAVLMVTHETDAAQYADRLFRMNAGKIEEIRN